MTLVMAGAVLLTAVGLFLLTARQPLVGCAVLALTVPLTAGMARGALIPMLRPDEAMLAVVLVGFAAHRMRTQPLRPVGGLDLAIGGYAVGSVAIPWAVLTFTRHPSGLDTWLTVQSPAVFFVVYYIFSRSVLTGGALKVVINSAMVAGVIVSGIAVAEVVNVPGVRTFVEANYPAPVLSSFRPGSTLGQYSAVGAFGALTYLLALAIAAVTQRGLPGLWLALVMAAGALGVVVSQAWAPLAVLPVITLVIVFYARRIPREMVVAAGVGLIGLVYLWPLIGAQFAVQVVTTAQGFALPESLPMRIRYWNEFVIPALSNHAWLGTGTVIPGSVPAPVSQLVDNEYLWAVFRAGLPGVALLVGMLLSIGVVAWSVRSSTDSSRRALGAAALAAVVMLALLGATAQYVVFAGLSLEIAMLVGALAGLTTQAYARRAPDGLLLSEPHRHTLPGRAEA